MKSTQVPIHRALTLTELTKTWTWDQGWKQMQSRREVYMAEGSVGLGSSLGTSRGLSVTAVPAAGVEPPVCRMRETTGSIPKQKTGLRNEN